MSAVSDSSNKPSSTTSTQQVVRVSQTALPYQRARYVATLILSAVAILSMIVFLVTAIQSRQHAFFGAMLNPLLTVDGTVTITDTTWPGLANGLIRQDHIISINGQQLMETEGDYRAAREKFLSIMRGLRPEDQVNVTFMRPEANVTVDPHANETCGPVVEGFADCSLSYSIQMLPDNDFLVLFVIPFVLGVIILGIGLVVFYLRPNQPAARLVTIFCLHLAVFMAGSYNVNNTYALVGVWLFANLSMGWPLLTLALVFPIRTTLVYRFPPLIYVPFILHLGAGLFAFFMYLNPPSPLAFPSIWQIGPFLVLLAAVVLSINLLRRRAHASSPMIRDQCNTVLIGIALTVIPLVMWLVNTVAEAVIGQTPFIFNTSAIMLFFLMPPVTLAYAVLQYRNLDTDRIISQGITYSILLIVLVLGYFLLVFGASLVTQSVIQADNPFVIAMTIFIIAVLFLPVRSFLQRRIDRIYFRTRSNYQERVEAFARVLTTVPDFDQIVAAYQKQLSETVAPAHTFIFLPSRQSGDYAVYAKGKAETDIHFDAQSPLIDLLTRLETTDYIYLEPGRPWPSELVTERARLGILKTMVITRLRGRQQLVGFVSISAPQSERGTYNYEELRFIQNLTSQMAVAVERAQVVESLERRVRELDVLSQVSQAVNFTIEFDDLLELINAQTDKLLEASHFYIVLRERATERLYFAFFLEDDERYREKENRRWAMSRDLYSEIIRDELPMRVDDFAVAMAQRHSPIIYEDTELKAWMGVPLIAGNDTLGVLAIATREHGRTFSDDQLKIFTDIASLAATSLDKARLFAETNLRARQLSALNDISQKLASELNVENLLELITESAVQILEAEAGSLLLMAEDAKELIFTVAVGESGQDLIGRRFPANRGLVGEVVSTAQSVIVNDAANDPRWGGEVAKGKFSTTAVLAAPLIAQSRVIGVLEVLNKRSGGIYVKEDAELLMTFAGQGAIAIENARLFEMTDLQLNQRVSELEILEKIDVELNRSLDLQKVADITMRWAIANSSASAGALGLVIGDSPNQALQIISRYGYGDGDEPEGAEGPIWPLDKGIVSRVMRTRQPDLVPDVRIDPSYIPSLRGATSQLTIPMLSGGEINAILILEKDVEPRLNLLDMAFATRLAEHASIAIANAQFAAELTRANESKSVFVGFVAHELKTPMTSMKGFTELLMSGVAGELNENQLGFLKTIRSNIDRMNTLVSDLRDVTQIETKNFRMELSAIDFRNVVMETLRPLTRQIEDKGQQLIMQIPENLPHILADQNRLIQVMTNLVSNAHKYTPQDGDIVLNARVVENQKDEKGRDLGPALHVSVKDNGIGMSEDDLSRLFTPYFRSDNPLTREQPGTGLGLTITRTIIQQHGGHIWVESQLNDGTTFNFTVPIVTTSGEAEKLEEETQPIK